jgi:hypothetical protein
MNEYPIITPAKEVNHLKKKVKIILIVIVAILLSMFLLHVTTNNILPWISQLHGGAI